MTENPATADSQHQPPIQRLRDTFYETTSCMCRFGMVGRKGLPFLKRVRLIAIHKKFTDALDLQCQRDHQHEKAEDSNTSLSAQYPPKLADTPYARPTWTLWLRRTLERITAGILWNHEELTMSTSTRRSRGGDLFLTRRPRSSPGRCRRTCSSTPALANCQCAGVPSTKSQEE